MRGRYVVLALLLVFGALVVRHEWCGLKTGEVAVPAVTAGPEDVVRAYVAALDQHDLATAKALSTPDKVATSGGWYRHTRSIKGLEVRAPIPEGPGSGQTRAGDREAVFVPVSFDLNQCGGDGTLQDGWMPWGYLLSRESPTARWLVTDEGPA